MICPHCGTQIDDGSIFCGSCGANLSSAPTAPAPPMTPAVAPQQPAAYYATAPTAPTALGPYPKASITGRFFAVLVDSIIGSALLVPGILLGYAAVVSENLSILAVMVFGLGALWQFGYTLFRDGVHGAGFGKRLVGQVVVFSASGAPAGLGASFLRQFVLLALGIIPAVGSVIEPIMVVANPEGRRLGDKAAKTQVAQVSDVIARGHIAPTGKGLAIAMLLVSLLVSIAGGIAGGVVMAHAIDDAVQGIDTLDNIQSTEDATLEEPAAIEVETGPEAILETFYLALARQDSNAMLETFSEELAYYTLPETMRDWVSPSSYRFLQSETSPTGIVTVDVQEYDSDNTPLGVITYVVIEENGEWKIDDWNSGDVDGASDSDTQALNAETATDAVGSLLVALQQDDSNGAQAVCTDAFKQAEPSFFYSTEGAFTEFEIRDVYQDVDTWVVEVRETWISGPEFTTYIVVESGGRALIDGVLY